MDNDLLVVNSGLLVVDGNVVREKRQRDKGFFFVKNEVRLRMNGKYNNNHQLFLFGLLTP